MSTKSKKNSVETLSWLIEQTRACGADAADVVMFDTVSINITQRLGKPEAVERSESAAIGLRAFCGKRQAMVSTTDTSLRIISHALLEKVGLAL